MQKSFRMAAFVISLGILTGTATICAASPRTIDVRFEQKFASEKCPDTAPAGFFCLNVSGIAKDTPLGPVSFNRRVSFDIKKFDEKHPTCIPDETSGVLSAPNGTITFRAPGSVCLEDGTASYGLIVTGGTGAFKGYVGDGSITVPPPIDDSSGRELWHLQLYRPG